MTNSTTKNRPSVAVIGAGYWGKNLVRNFYDLGALKLICEKNDSMLSDIIEKYNNVKAAFHSQMYSQTRI